MRVCPVFSVDLKEVPSVARASARLALFIFTLVVSTGAPAASPALQSVYLEDLTWTELKGAISTGKTIVIVPIGGTEQNGPDIALGKHNVRASVLAGRIAKELGDAIVAPVVAYVPEGRIDPPEQHMRFPGTISVSDETFEQLLESAARSFKEHGFKDIVFLGDHGGYQADLRQVAERLNQQWRASGVRAHALGEYYRVTEDEYVAELKRRGYSGAEIGTHAGLADASLTLALAPQLVRTDRLATDLPSSAQGEYGDPRRASAELGQLGADLIVAHSVAAIRQALSHARLP
ncbi:MAG: creatininase family protein [Burkholderiaceae bacterium]|jgi:creatinine amidohydrolase/Fe(II)-dependent formamide hydrolase-like protein